MNIQSGKIRIRNATADDAQVLSKWWNNGKIMAHAGFPKGLGTTSAKIIKSLSNDNNFNRRLIIELENKPIGEMSYRTPQKGTAEIGIKICVTSQQNKGYGTTSLKLLMSYIFINLKYEKIILDTNLSNLRAQIVYEKLGFRKIKTNIDSWRDQLGRLQSSVDYEILKNEYLELYDEESVATQIAQPHSYN